MVGVVNNEIYKTLMWVGQFGNYSIKKPSFGPPRYAYIYIPYNVVCKYIYCNIHIIHTYMLAKTWLMTLNMFGLLTICWDGWLRSRHKMHVMGCGVYVWWVHCMRQSSEATQQFPEPNGNVKTAQLANGYLMSFLPRCQQGTNGSKCPYCVRRKICVQNSTYHNSTDDRQVLERKERQHTRGDSLHTLLPKLSAEWDYDRSGITPADVAFSQSRLVAKQQARQLAAVYQWLY